MSYRTFKRVLSETSLERKCRFLFGASLALLILTTFFLVDVEVFKIVMDKPRSNGRHLAASILRALHAERLESPERRQMIEKLNNDLEPLAYESMILSLGPTEHDYVQPAAVGRETEILNELRRRYLLRMAKERGEAAEGDRSDMPSSLLEDESVMPNEEQVYETYKGEIPDSFVRKMKLLGEYRYYQPVYWKAGCIGCHRTLHDELQGLPATASDDEFLARLPFRAARIDLKNQPTQRNINKIRAFLIAMGIVTVFLAMVALYIVVRYVIAKPLQHLQQISEQVEQGNYGARAQIETGDEFEDLASSFNRMVRHLVETQSELQQANTKLDLKVDELAQANMQLFELNRLKSEFLANVSHELRTPLNSIIGFADVLKDIASLESKQKRYVENIGRSGKVLLEMINDILDLAKLESGRVNIRPTEFSIGAVVQSQIDVVRGLAIEKNLDISCNCPADLPDVFLDQAKVQQILTNLLSNAIKFTPDGGRISVTVQPTYPQTGGTKTGDDRLLPVSVSITVADTGIGVAAEDHDVIFEKFRQATPLKGTDNLTREFSGTGLGLSIIRELCNLLGGEITFTSQLGHGSAFTVTLPWAIKPSVASDGDSAVMTISASQLRNVMSSERGESMR